MAVAGAALGEATEIVIDIKPGHREAAPAQATPPKRPTVVPDRVD